jgi:predicted nucleotidyltransferase
MPPERSIPDSFDPAIVTGIDARLAVAECDEHVRIPIAIESGSRAWGFPSPDSDYDCRFVFVRRHDDYRSLWQPRDVVETPLDAIYDVSGWDIGKLIKLMVKGNAVAIEWLTSPIRYRFDQRTADRLLDLAREVTDRAALRRHYYSLAKASWMPLDREKRDVPLKKLLYALRPAVAMTWLDRHPGEVVAPMAFAQSLDAIDLAPALRAEIDALVERKSITAELGSAPVPSAIAALIDTVLAANPPVAVDPVAPEERRRAADRVFLELLDELAPA